MSDLKSVILDAKYVDMISLADFIVQDCDMPDTADNGAMLPQANEVAAAIFRWAAGAAIEPTTEPDLANDTVAAAPVEEASMVQPQAPLNPWTNTATGVTDTNEG